MEFEISESSRLLRASVDGLAFVSRGQRVTDVLGRVRVLNEALDAVCAVVEGAFPRGRGGSVAVCRDETGCVFRVPDTDGLLDRLGQRVRDAFAAGTAGEACLGAVEVSEPFSGDGWPGEFLCRPIPPLSADPQAVVSWWESADLAEVADVCGVCGLRPQGHGMEGDDRQEARAQGLCGTCLARRRREAGEWASVLDAVDKSEQMALLAVQVHLDRAFASFVSFAPFVSPLPAIPLLAGPRTTLALVPAGEAMTLAHDIHARYRETPGLPPLSLALVFARRHIPLPAILDAGRRLLTARPGTFDFVHLDTAARRFDVCYDEEGRRRDRPTRPVPLADLSTLAELWDWIGPGNLAPARRRDLLALVETRRTAWGQPVGGPAAAYHPAFRQWVRDALAQAGWRARPGEEAMARLCEAALVGVLADLEEMPNSKFQTPNSKLQILIPPVQ